MEIRLSSEYNLIFFKILVENIPKEPELEHLPPALPHPLKRAISNKQKKVKRRRRRKEKTRKDWKKSS